MFYLFIKNYFGWVRSRSVPIAYTEDYVRQCHSATAIAIWWCI